MRTFTHDQAAQFVQEELLWGAAAGTCKDIKTAIAFAQVGMKIILWGSDTFLGQPGNPGDNFFYCEETGDSLNALGIPNRGHDAYLPEMAEAKAAVNALGAQLWGSYSSGPQFQPGEYHRMAKASYQGGCVDVHEGNTSCGNMRVGDTYKPTICMDRELFEICVHELCAGSGGLPVAIKHGPTTDRDLLEHNVRVCLKYGVRYLIYSNTIPNQHLYRADGSVVTRPDGSPAIAMGKGGAGGRILRPTVKEMNAITKPLIANSNIEIINACGNYTGADVYECLMWGARGFVCNTLLTKNGNDPNVMMPIFLGGESNDDKGLIELLVEHGLPD